MRKLDMSSYMVEIKAPDKMMPGKTIRGEYPYNVKELILNLLFHQGLQLTSAELVRHNMLAMKLESCKEDEILLEDAEFARIKKAVDTFKGFNRNDVKFVTRINEAWTVVVEQK